MNYSLEISTDEPVRMEVGPDSNIITISKGGPTKPKILNRFPKDYQSKAVRVLLFLLGIFIEFSFRQSDQELGRNRRAVHQLAEEVGILRRSFKKAIHVVMDQDQREKRSGKMLKEVDDQLVEDLVEQMKDMDTVTIRKMRAVTDEMKINPESMENEQMEDEKCEVRNFTCVNFPTRSQCTGIAMGGCLTRLQILSMIFSPRVVLFLLVGIAGLTAAALFFSYYWYSISLYSSKNEMFSILGVIS